jgi:hypothetical protein
MAEAAREPGTAALDSARLAVPGLWLRPSTEEDLAFE